MIRTTSNAREPVPVHPNAKALALALAIHALSSSHPLEARELADELLDILERSKDTAR